MYMNITLGLANSSLGLHAILPLNFEYAKIQEFDNNLNFLTREKKIDQATQTIICDLWPMNAKILKKLHIHTVDMIVNL